MLKTFITAFLFATASTLGAYAQETLIRADYARTSPMPALSGSEGAHTFNDAGTLHRHDFTAPSGVSVSVIKTPNERIAINHSTRTAAIGPATARIDPPGAPEMTIFRMPVPAGRRNQAPPEPVQSTSLGSAARGPVLLHGRLTVMPPAVGGETEAWVYYGNNPPHTVITLERISRREGVEVLGTRITNIQRVPATPGVFDVPAGYTIVNNLWEQMGLTRGTDLGTLPGR